MAGVETMWELLPLVSLVSNLSQLWFLVAQCAKLGGFFQLNDAKVYLGRQTGGRGGEESPNDPQAFSYMSL